MVECHFPRAKANILIFEAETRKRVTPMSLVFWGLEDRAYHDQYKKSRTKDWWYDLQPASRTGSGAWQKSQDQVMG